MRHPELRVGLMTLLLPLYLSVAFSASYIGALHTPKPHHVKVAIVGAPAATGPLAHELSSKPPNGYDVRELTSVSRARQLVGERKLAGAYVVDPERPEAIVATAASPSMATFVEGTFREVAAAQGRPLAVDDVRPLPPDNATGSPNFFFIVTCTLAGFMTVVALGLVASTLPEGHRLAIVVSASLIAPIVGYLIGGPGYGSFSGDFGTIMAMLGMGVLYTYAVAAITRLMQLGIGKLAPLLASVTLVFLSIPSAGGTIAAPLMPGFWRFLSHFWLGAAALDANRSVLYLGGAGVGIDVLKILAWIAAWAALLAIPIYVGRTRGRRPTVARPPALEAQAA